MTTEDVQALRAQLIRHEGVRLKPYADSVGKLTIGVGRNLIDRGISPSEAMELLDNDIAGAIGGLTGRLPWFPSLDPVRQRVLIDMAFNLGVGGVLGFPRMLDACRRGDYEEAADEMLDSTWARQVKGRADRLARWMRTGVISQ